MKLHGRITFFGEYLLKENLSYCLCIKSKLFLSRTKSEIQISFVLRCVSSNPFLRDRGELPDTRFFSVLGWNSIHGIVKQK